MDNTISNPPEGVVERVRTMIDPREGAPFAVVLPTTAQTIQLARRLQARHGYLVVGGRLPGPSLSPAQLLQEVRQGQDRRPPVLVFTDQIVGAADASILVRSVSGDRYFSPLEFILGAKYGYTLIVWTRTQDRLVPPGHEDIAAVMSALACHLDSAAALDELWLAESVQELRTPLGRRILAQRKLRFFKAAVINAYRDAPEDLGAERMIRKVEVLETSVEASAP